MTPHRARTLTTIPDLAELNAECQHVPVVINGPAIVYGKGELGQMAMDHLRAINRPAFHQIDADWLGDHDRIPDPMLRAQVLVAVARWPYVPIESALTAQGFTNVAPFLDVTPNHPEHPLANGWFADPLDLDRVQSVLDMFADDVSRMHYIAFLAWRRLREEWTFTAAPLDVEGPRYWPPEVASVLVQGNEVFIDGGSYDGKVSERFLYRFGGEAVTIDPEGQPNLKVALGSADDEALAYIGYGYASRLLRAGDENGPWSPVDMISLDSLNHHCPGIVPTFIKLHLEGHELPALRGAVRTIETHRSILAITTYHNDDGIDRIPAFMRDHCPNYRFLWRNSAYVGEGSVMFAIPNERTA